MNELLASYPGYFYQQDYLAITEIARLLPDEGSLVEIGCLFGKSAACWSTILKQLGKNYKIYTLDRFTTINSTFITDGRYQRLSGNKNLIRPYIMAEMNQEEMARQLLSNYDNVTVINYDIFKNHPSELNIDNIHCVFEDANHRSVGVRRSFVDWYPLVTPNGIYSGHDYDDTDQFDVKRETDLIAKEQKISVVVPNADSTVYYIQKQQ
jgi:hypothetical protein